MSTLLAALVTSASAQERAPSVSSSTPSGVAYSTSTGNAIPVDVSTTSVMDAALPVSTSAALAPVISTTSLPAEPEELLPPPRPWVIGEITSKGLKNVKFSAIRSQVKSKKGDLYDRPDLDRDIQAVLGLGSFERVAADIESTHKPVPDHLLKVSGSTMTIRLTFIVVEKPIIKKVKFEGNKKMSKAALQDVAQIKPKDHLDPVKLREDEQKLLDKYHEKGFLDAKIETEIVKDTTTLQAFVTYKIDEGPKSKIFWVGLKGVTAFKTNKLLKPLKNRRKKVFVDRDLAEDQRKLENEYLNNGYLDVVVSSPTVFVSEDKERIYIDYSIAEGRQYRFGETTFSGYSVLKSSELYKMVDYRKGRLFNQERYEDTIRSIQEAYAEVGRLRARVTPTKTHNAATDLMDVHYAITEGDIVYIDHVDVEGAKATKPWVLKREVTVKPGQHFQASKIRKSREKIMNLGFIDDVEIDVQQSPTDQDKVDLAFDVVEGKPGVLTAGAAYSSLDGLIGTLSLQHMNLFGRAQRASVQWSFGRRVQDYSLSWTTPWLGNKPTSLGLDVFNTRRVNPFQGSLSAYIEKNRGGTVRLGPRFEEDKYQLNFAYSFSQIGIFNVQEQFRNTLTEGTSIYSWGSVELARDTRDNIYDPTRGSRSSIGMQLAGGPFQGNIHFFKPSIMASKHFKLFEVEDYPFVLTFANRGAYITQFGETKEVPVFNRFYLGGQDTLRGYQATGEVGYPSGGKLYDVFNVEFGFPLARERRRTIVKFVVFFDAGGAWDNARSAHLRIGSGERDIKTDAGFGIRFTTPAFPIRLDWGYGFNHRPGEKKYQINFGLGNLF